MRDGKIPDQRLTRNQSHPGIHWDWSVRILLRILNPALLDLKSWCSARWTRARLSWVLLTLVALCLLSAPLTQRLWTWDGFMHGGQDFETCAFLILISLCLVLVLVRVCKSGFERMLAALAGATCFRFPVAQAAPLCVPIAFIPQRWNALAACSIPLQI